jgi:hypothetical protein
MQVAPRKVELEFSDRTRSWQFDVNAFIALHEELGGDALEQIQELKDGVKPSGKIVKILRALIYCGLVTAEPDIKASDIGGLMTLDQMNEKLIPVLEAMNESLAGPTPAAPTPVEALERQ